MASKISYERLEQTIQTVELFHNDLTSGGMSDQYGICEQTAKALEFLNGLTKLYWTCPYCDRPIAPDEDYIEDNVTEIAVCMKCAEEGY